MPIIVEDEDQIIDVIYETVCGYKLGQAVQILEKYRTKQLIPVKWIEDYTRKNFPIVSGEIVLGFMADMLEEWEKENEESN